MSASDADWGSAPAPTNAPLSAPELAAYLARIGLAPAPAAAAAVLPSATTAAALREVVRAHAFSVPFESLDVTLRAHISLAPRDIFEKLVARRRGGFCLETSLLLRSALQALGFELRLRLARVWMRTPAEAYAPREPPIPRLHLVLIVRADGGDEYLVDVGFGGGGPPEPLPLRPSGGGTASGGDSGGASSGSANGGDSGGASGGEVNGGVGAAAAFRIDAGDAALGEDSFVVFGVQGGAWRRLYSFEHVSWDCPRVHAADFLPVSLYVQAGRGTLFHTMRVATRPLPDGGRLTLLGRELRRREGAERLGAAPALEVSAVADAAEYRRLAAEHFGIELSEEQAQRIFDADAPPQ
jgi:arylamine N-acetyltransferase